MITGVHVLVYTPEAQALRTVLRETLGWDYVEAHDPPDGWQIFALPPAELGVHPTDGSAGQELWLMCDDLDATVAELQAKGIEFRGEPRDDDFGRWIAMLLPGGFEAMLYAPSHPTAV